MALPPLPKEFSWAETIELGSPEVYRLSRISWPRFLLGESDIPDPILKFQISAQDFKEKFRVFGIRHAPSGLLVAFIQAVHVDVDPSAQKFPDLGWRFSIQDAARSSQKNAMSLVEASIDPDYRGHGLSKHLIERVKREAREKKFSLLLAPVRTTLKTRHPEESIEAYCARKDSQGRIYDPWLRTHLEAGGVITNICHDSVCVKATLQKWREWTGLSLDQNGPHFVTGALMPVLIDAEAGLGVYTEPNGWVKYTL